jgi:hypothetical protein
MSGGAISDMGCVVRQSFAAGGNQLHLDLWAVTCGLQYLRYKTPTAI